MIDINKFIRLREKAGLTQTGLAEKTFVSPQFINGIERGFKTPGVALLKRIADCLGVLDNGYDPTGVVEWFDDRYIIGYSKDEDGDWGNYDDLLSAGNAEKPKGGTWRFKDVEVIGNIYDNPELLEGAE